MKYNLRLPISLLPGLISLTLHIPSCGTMDLPTLTTISPLTNQPIHTRSSVSEAEIPLLAQSAETAFSPFRRTSLKDRQTIVSKALELLEQDALKFAQHLTNEIGRPVAQAENEIHTAVARGRYLVKISQDALKDTPGEVEKGFVRYIKKVPVGPVLVIFAWNVRPSSRASDA